MDNYYSYGSVGGTLLPHYSILLAQGMKLRKYLGARTHTRTLTLT